MSATPCSNRSGACGPMPTSNGAGTKPLRFCWCCRATKENYTRALWFSEGVTSTAEGTIQLRAGLLDEKQYLQRLGEQITELERRPAHLTQSAEESSLDAWLEGSGYY